MAIKLTELIENPEAFRLLAAAQCSATCSKCKQPLDATELQERRPCGRCDACYYEELGEEIEKHPICNPARKQKSPNS